MDWFLYDNGLRHERVKDESKPKLILHHQQTRILRRTSPGMYFTSLRIKNKRNIAQMHKSEYIQKFSN